jgi:hypothetical protein
MCVQGLSWRDTIQERAGGVARMVECLDLASARPWVQAPVLPKKQEKSAKKRIVFCNNITGEQMLKIVIRPLSSGELRPLVEDCFGDVATGILPPVWSRRGWSDTKLPADRVSVWVGYHLFCICGREHSKILNILMMATETSFTQVLTNGQGLTWTSYTRSL